MPSSASPKRLCVDSDRFKSRKHVRQFGCLDLLEVIESFSKLRMRVRRWRSASPVSIESVPLPPTKRDGLREVTPSSKATISSFPPPAEIFTRLRNTLVSSVCCGKTPRKSSPLLNRILEFFRTVVLPASNAWSFPLSRLSRNLRPTESSADARTCHHHSLQTL